MDATRPSGASTPKSRLAKLEAVRGLAALYVVVHHADLFEGSGFHVLVSFGQEAVILFFLLSGFVIYYSTFGSGHRVSWRTYLVSRVRRIWPLYLFALAFGYVLTSASAHGTGSLSLQGLGGNLLMLQDVSALKPGVWFDTFGGNAPLWSLSYEWWFYIAFFPVALYMAHRVSAQKYVVFAVSLMGAIFYEVRPNQICLFLAYFLIWWAGAELGREFSRRRVVTFRGQAASLVMLATLCGVWVLGALILHRHAQHERWGTYPILQIRHAAAAVAFIALGITWSKWRFIGFRLTLAPLAFLAPFSYALYVLHYPVLMYLSKALAVPAPFRLLLCLAVVVPLAYVLEVRIQPHVNRWFDDRFLGSVADSQIRTDQPQVRPLPEMS